MIIETFPRAAAAPIQAPPFVRIGQVWEMQILARAFACLGPANLIISDGLSFLVDRIVSGDTYDGFVRVTHQDDDHADVLIAAALFDDLREGCVQLAAAILEDQCIWTAPARIHEAEADHVFRICRTICRLS